MILGIKWILGSRIQIYTSTVISIQHYHGKIIDSNHDNGTQPNKHFKVFKKHRVNDQLLTVLLTGLQIFF